MYGSSSRHQTSKTQHQKIAESRFFFPNFVLFVSYDLFVISKKRNHEFTNSPIHEFKVLQKDHSAYLLKPLFNSVLFLIYYFKKHFKPCFIHLKGLKDIL